MSVTLNIKGHTTTKMAGKFTRFSEKRDTTVRAGFLKHTILIPI